MTVDRRTFLQRSSYVIAGAAATRLQATQRLTWMGDWGVALFTVRDGLSADPSSVFTSLAAIGFSRVEMLPSQLDLVPKVKAAGLDATSLLIDTPTVTGASAAWDSVPSAFRSPQGYDIHAAIKDAKEHGIRFLIAFYLMPQERSTLDSYRQVIDSMNQAGEQCQAAGVELCYHHHGFEFEQLEGQVPMELLISGLDRRYVNFEIDAFWLSLTGRDPVEMIQRVGPRARLLKLRDKATDAPVQYDDQLVSPETFVELGRGAVDVNAVLGAAAEAGVAHVFVEQDHAVATGDPLKSLRISHEYLSTLGG